MTVTRKTLIFAVLSVLIPATGYAFACVFPGPGLLIPLLISNALGLALSLISLARSNEKPTNVTWTMRAALFFSGIGLLGNIISLQWLLALILNF